MLQLSITMKRKIFYLTTLALSGFYCCANAAMVLQPLSYTDALISLNGNPGRGFYRPVGMHLTEGGNKPANTWGDLVHLRVDIGAFSSNAVLSVSGSDTVRGKSQPLTKDALDALSKTLAGIRSRGKMAVLRVCYDPWYNGASKPEPDDQQQVIEHLRQLAPVYNENSDVLLAVELGMYGPWGEMHTSRLGTNENIAQALQTLLVATAPDVKVLVRRPDIIATWMGLTKKEFVVGSPAFEAAAAAKGDTMFRVGMFNDGYLGSSSDLGTVDGSLTRDMMVNWLQTYSTTVPYGGELVANYNGSNPINTPSYLSLEGFRTHTTYLNYEWHQATILAMKDSVMHGVDAEYEGASGFKYLEDHLGYRLVLRNALLPDTLTDRVLSARLSIDNVGFAGICGDKKISMLLIGESDTLEFPVTAYSSFDSRNDNNLDGNKQLDVSLTLPATLKNGSYSVYLRISRNADFRSDRNYQCIQFANTADQYSADLGANLVGAFVLNRESSANILTESNLPACWQIGSMLYTKGVRRLKVWDVQGRLLIDKKIEDGEALEVGPRRVLYRILQ